jgi:hypothetical protein
MGDLRSQVIRLAYAQTQLRPQLLPLLVEDTTDPKEIHSRVIGALAYLRSLNEDLVKDFDRWRLDQGFNPSLDMLKRAQQGYETARAARLAMANLVDLFPTINEYVLTWTESNRLDAEMANRMEESKTILKSVR